MWGAVIALSLLLLLAGYEALEWRIKAEKTEEENVELRYQLGINQGCQHVHRHSIDCPGVTIAQLREQAAENGQILADFQGLGEDRPFSRIYLAARIQGAAIEVPNQRLGGDLS